MKSFLQRIKTGLKKSKHSLEEKIGAILPPGQTTIDEGVLDELEEALITSDIGYEIVEDIISRIRNRSRLRYEMDVNEAKEIIREVLRTHFIECDREIRCDKQPKVILMIGINGSGKTTTVGKLASKYAEEGKKVLVAAGDTFRAAAIDQLAVWCDRAGVEIVRHKEESDPSAVIFDALTAAQARKCDIVLVDTAGRLHSKVNLMDELKKICRVMDKALPGAPHETLLVLDGTIGQNSIQQAKLFNEVVAVSGVVITKLDGTAKGGVIVKIESDLKIPVKFIGTGETAEDLNPFHPNEFLEAIL